MSNSKSYMPNGGYTLTQGSNYMMDGFHFDTEYGGGPQEKARLPESKGLADLPSGMIPLESSGISMLPNGVETEVDLNLEEITREASQEINIVDHNWLASQPKPDLSGQHELEEIYKDLADGHMNNPRFNQIKTLEKSWGYGETTGLDIIPNENRNVDLYHNSYRDDQSKLPADDYREEMERGVRKLAYGRPLNLVLSEVSESRVLSAKAKFASEYGLNGRVYIKEEHFPGLFNGKWDEVINKRCATSMYIIPNSKDCAFDRFLGMEVVNEIPWNKAAKALLPKLESYGVRIGSGSAKERLQSAFIDLIEGRVSRQEKSATWFPTQLDQSSLLSLDHARRELEVAREENIFVASTEDVEQSKVERKLQRIAKQLVAQRFLDGEQVSAVVSLENKTASEKISRLYELASTPTEAKSYAGYGQDASYHNMHKHHTNSKAHIPKKGSRELKKRISVAQKKIAGLIEANLISIDEVEKVAKKIHSPEDKVRAVLRVIENKREKTSTYKGQSDNFEARLTTDQLASLQNSFFNKASSQSKVAYEREVMSKINNLIESGVVSMSQFEKVVQKHGSLSARLQAIYSLVSKPLHIKKASGQKGHYGSKASKTAKIEYTASDWSKAQDKVSKLVETGLLSQESVDSLSSISNPSDFVRKAFDLASKPNQASQYVGEETAHILGGKKSHTVSSTEKKVATWVRQKMSEGSAGEELDVLIATRFNQNVVNEYNSKIASVRSEHEGISGHAYVDASAYMTKGTEGCDKGALVHRSNQIPTLLKTSKCGSCVFNSNGTCQKYNKTIIASADEIVESPSKYQQEMIRLANASDSEQTASLFVNNYDANEFNLTASADVSLDDTPSHEQLGDVLFGGFEV